jgi:hypothetical protein
VVVNNMSKRKKRRRNTALSAFGLGSVAAYDEDAPLYQRKFHQGDIVWLAKEYGKQRDTKPSLTLEDFAAQYGILADELRLYFPELNRGFTHSVILWHGTSMSRARSIMAEGFRAGVGNKIFFTRNPAVARRYALARGGGGDDQPTVIMCSIDLWQYNCYERREDRDIAFVFEHKRIGSEVIMQVTTVAKQRRGAKLKRRKDTGIEPFEIALSFNSGRAGIAYWINNHLKLNDRQKVHEDHEVVEGIKQWLDAQADVGRIGEVPDDEIMEQVRKYIM